MAKKATHSGECQICGRKQKLPGGRLSKHGYTKRWGFFEGTCPGAEELPFEQSKDLIEPIVVSTESRLASLRTESKSLKAGTLADGNVALVHHYFGGRTERGHYEWIETEIFAEFVKWSDGISEGGSEGYCRFSYKAEDKDHRIDVDYQCGHSLDAARRYLNTRYAEYELDRRANELQSYVDWQRGRLANWAPKELTPVIETAGAR